MKTIGLLILIGLVAGITFAQNAQRIPSNKFPQLHGGTDSGFSSPVSYLGSADETLDSTYSWFWITDQWNSVSKAIYTYNDKGLISQNMQFTFNGAWSPNILELFTYDDGDHLIDYTTQLWDGTAWVPSGRVLSDYDGDGNLLTYVSQSWNGVDWDNVYMYTYTYGDFHNVLTWETNHWFGMWVTSMRHLYTYDDEQYLVNRLVQSKDSTGWVNLLQINYHYDIHGDRDVSITQDWVGNAWSDSERSLYDYDDNHNLLLQEVQDFIAGDWYSNYRLIYAYNSFNNITGLTLQAFNNNEWENQYDFTEEYTANQNRLSEVFRLWMDGAWVNQDSSYNYYTEVSSTHPMDIEDKLFLFPNPAGNTLNIYAENGDLTNGAITVFSSAGVRVGEGQINFATNQINVGNLHPGNYFLVLHQNNKTAVGKFVKQ